MKSGYSSVDLDSREEDRNDKDLADEAGINVIEVHHDIGEDAFFDVIEHTPWYAIVFQRKILGWMLAGVIILCFWFYWVSVTWSPLGILSLDEEETRHVSYPRTSIVLSSDGNTIALLSAIPITSNNSETDIDMHIREVGRVRIFQLPSSKTWNLEFDTANTIVGSDSVTWNASSIALSADASMLTIIDQSSEDTNLMTFLRSYAANSNEKWQKVATENDNISYQIGGAMALSKDSLRMVFEEKNADSKDFSVKVVRFNKDENSWDPSATDFNGGYLSQTPQRFAISGDGKRIVVGSGNAIFIYEQSSDDYYTWNVIGSVDSDANTENLLVGNGALHALAMAEDGTRIAVSSAVDAKNPTIIRTHVLEYDGNVSWKVLGKPMDVNRNVAECRFAMAFSGDGNVLAVTEESNAVRVMRLQHNRWTSYGRPIVPEFSTDQSHISLSLSFHGDRIGVAVSSYGQKDFVRVFELK